MHVRLAAAPRARRPAAGSARRRVDGRHAAGRESSSSRRRRASGTTRSRPGSAPCASWPPRGASAVDSTENGAAFNTRSLKRYRAVVFLSTTGDVLTAPQQRAFERYVRGGGGFVGVHAAADTEYGWAWYGRLVGARFRSHPLSSRQRSKCDTAVTSLHGRSSAAVDEDGRVVQLRVPPAAWHARARDAGRDVVHAGRGRDGAGPSDRLGAQPPGRPGLVHGRRPHRGVLRGAALPPAPDRRNPVGGAAYAAAGLAAGGMSPAWESTASRVPTIR